MEEVEGVVAEAVGACGDDEACDVGLAEGGLVDLAELADGGVGGAVGLEVGVVFHVGVFAAEEFFALADLPGDVAGGAAVVGGEAVVAAVGAASAACAAVAVGAGEACVDHDALYLVWHVFLLGCFVMSDFWCIFVWQTLSFLQYEI